MSTIQNTYPNLTNIYFQTTLDHIELIGDGKISVRPTRALFFIGECSRRRFLRYK